MTVRLRLLESSQGETGHESRPVSHRAGLVYVAVLRLLPGQAHMVRLALTLTLGVILCGYAAGHTLVLYLQQAVGG